MAHTRVTAGEICGTKTAASIPKHFGFVCAQGTAEALSRVPHYLSPKVRTSKCSQCSPSKPIGTKESQSAHAQDFRRGTSTRLAAQDSAYHIDCMDKWDLGRMLEHASKPIPNHHTLE
eukprot:scaffold140893_cov15-Tisochrysis_lutea.AAC.2